MRRDRWLFSLAVCILMAGYGLMAQTHWTNYSDNPVIDESFDSGSDITHRPSVVFDGSVYYMFYTSGRTEMAGPVEVVKNHMAYATSQDGIEWTLVDPTVLSPSGDENRFDQFHAGHGWVMMDQDTFKMWYWGFNINTTQNNIGLAWSTDGANWTRVFGPGHLGSVYDLAMAGLSLEWGLPTPCVLKKDGVYHMWHSQIHIATNTYQIAYATSPDGIHWTKVFGDGPNGAVLEYGGSDDFDMLSTAWPAVLPTADGFEMWYYGYGPVCEGLGYAVSSDGVHWQKISGSGNHGACFNDAHAVSVIKMDHLYKMWYAVFADQDIVNYATSVASADVQGMHFFVPVDCALYPNHPNPFNPETQVTYFISKSEYVRIRVLDISGRCVRTLVNGIQPAGFRSLPFDAGDLASGTYLCRFDTESQSEMIRMLLIK
ncbi:T9SS type A sorting domain-containing protein [bacterium]|nr:T9SS type A sorting domain-containing protein [bacterium]